MGRSRTIDRDAVLDAAEMLVRERGGQALTIGAVAKAAGITKGGVQSCFGSKEAMLVAMLERWMGEERRLFEEAAGDRPTLAQRVAAHASAAKRYDDAKHRRTAGLLGLLLQSPPHLEEVRRWYAERVGSDAINDRAARNARLAFFATEGAFFLRYFNLLPMTTEEWNAVLEDAETLATAAPGR
jgi:AcrR family transcriptional regulator